MRPFHAIAVLALLFTAAEESFTSQLAHPESVVVYVENIRLPNRTPDVTSYERETKPVKLYRLDTHQYGWTWADTFKGPVVQATVASTEKVAQESSGVDSMAQLLSKGVVFRLPSKTIPKRARLELKFRPEYGDKLSITGVIADVLSVQTKDIR